MTTRLKPLPIVEKWDCHSCGGCCRTLMIYLDKDDLARLRDQRWHEHEEFRGVKIVAREALARGKRVLAKRKDGACVFLTDEGRCRIHEIYGEEAKPSVCRMFPFQLVPLESFANVTLRRGCPSAADDNGRPVKEHLDKLKNSGLVEKFAAHRLKPPTVIGRHRRSWRDYLIVADTLMRLTTDDNFPLVRRLVHGLRFCRLLADCKLKRIGPKSFRELISVLEPAALDGAGKLFQDRKQPTETAKRLFRQSAIHYIRCHPGFPNPNRLGERWRLLMTSTKFVRGQGRVPDIHPSFEKATFAELERPLGPLPEEIAAPLNRFFETQAMSKAYAIAVGRRSLVESYRALVLAYPMGLWLLRLAIGEREPARNDMIDLTGMLERGLGAAGVSRGAGWMAMGEQLERLVAWYAR